MLNRACRTFSVVGRVARPSGALRTRPPRVPPTIRTARTLPVALVLWSARESLTIRGHDAGREPGGVAPRGRARARRRSTTGTARRRARLDVRRAGDHRRQAIGRAPHAEAAARRAR